MKIKVSISMEQDTLSKVEERIKDSIFRNKSHFTEHATKRLLEEQ